MEIIGLIGRNIFKVPEIDEIAITPSITKVKGTIKIGNCLRFSLKKLATKHP